MTRADFEVIQVDRNVDGEASIVLAGASAMQAGALAVLNFEYTVDNLLLLEQAIRAEINAELRRRADMRDPDKRELHKLIGRVERRWRRNR